MGSPAAPDVKNFLADVDDVPHTTDPRALRRRSRDFFWYSPVLNARLHGLVAEAALTPRDEADVLRICAAAAKHRVPLTPQGGRTGNYGQAVPLEGGALLDMSAISGIVSNRPGTARIRAGMKMDAIDAELRPSGWELRMHPSTKRSATIGGFVAGGSGGVGSITYGGLRDPGNILSARIATVEPKPRILELRAQDAQKVTRAFGTTGIIIDVEMATAPAYPWIDVIVAFDDFLDACAFGLDLTKSDGIVKKLATAVAWPLPQSFQEISAYCPNGASLIIAMIAEPSMETFRARLAGCGTMTYEAPTCEGPGETPLYEFCWNHTTLHMLKQDRSVTYLQCLFPHDRLLETVRETVRRFGDEVPHHLEFSRYQGNPGASALPVVRYTDAARLDEIIAEFESLGVMVANPHVFTLEDGSRYRRADADQLGFKAEVDPFGLLNPGKMRSYVPRDTA